MAGLVLEVTHYVRRALTCRPMGAERGHGRVSLRMVK